MKKLALYKCFNPVAPTRGATGNNGANGLPAQLFQSTHPHGVRPQAFVLKTEDTVVSIHAPTRGATKKVRAANIRVDVSIHAPTRGATPYVRAVPLFRLFQSTHPHGVRLSLKFDGSSVVHSFNPRTHTGCDLAKLMSDISSEFQSTHPHGVRPVPGGSHRHFPCGFNPRTHTGCDLPYQR